MVIAPARLSFRVLATVVIGGFLVVGCAQNKYEYDTPKTKNEVRLDPTPGQGSLFGGDGNSLFGGDKKASPTAPIPVNSYLWRATLDTLSFLPLASADPFGGVIITDWYSPPESDNERFKMTAYILTRKLRADGLRVAVFRQVRDQAGNWVDGKVDAATARDLENTILTRARELRIASAAG